MPAGAQRTEDSGSVPPSLPETLDQHGDKMAQDEEPVTPSLGQRKSRGTAGDTSWTTVHPGRREPAQGGRGRLRSRRGQSGRRGLTRLPGSVPQPATDPFPAESCGPQPAGRMPTASSREHPPRHTSLAASGPANTRLSRGAPPARHLAPCSPRADTTGLAWRRVLPEARGAPAASRRIVTGNTACWAQPRPARGQRTQGSTVTHRQWRRHMLPQAGPRQASTGVTGEQRAGRTTIPKPGLQP